MTFGAATFSALEEDNEIANCDAAKADYISFISSLGKFSNSLTGQKITVK